MGYRLADDKRFSLRFDYRGDFVPCPVTVTIMDDSVTIKEIADLIYEVAKHPVKYEGEYIAGTAADAEMHKAK